MSSNISPYGASPGQARPQGRRTRSYWAFWRDQHGVRGGKPARSRARPRLRTQDSREARSSGGQATDPAPRPSTSPPGTPRNVSARSCARWRARASDATTRASSGRFGRRHRAGSAERKRDKDLKRTTLAGYEIMFERLYRDHGADTPVRDFSDGRLRDYFDDFKSYKVVSEKTAKKARAEGKDVQRIEVERWSAQPRDSAPRRGRHQGRGRSSSPTSCPAPGTICAAAPTESFRSTPSAPNPSPTPRRRPSKPTAGSSRAAKSSSGCSWRRPRRKLATSTETSSQRV